MGGSPTPWRVAPMQHSQASRDGTDIQFVRKPMHTHVSPSPTRHSKRHSAVALAINLAAPQPASSRQVAYGVTHKHRQWVNAIDVRLFGTRPPLTFAEATSGATAPPVSGRRFDLEGHATLGTDNLDRHCGSLRDAGPRSYPRRGGNSTEQFYCRPYANKSTRTAR